MKRISSLVIIIIQITHIGVYGQGSFQINKSLDSTINNLTAQVNTDSVASYIVGLQSFGTRYFYADNHRDVAKWIEQKLYGFGYAEVIVDSFAINNNGKIFYLYNISVNIKGKIDSNQVIVLGGHWDSFSDDPMNSAPGADDNASGSAAALEVARILKQSNFEPDLTLKFVLFDSEEQGLVGSYIYSALAFQNQVDIKLMLNNDMIANTTYNETSLKIHKYDNADWAAEAAYNLAGKYTYLLPVISNPSASSDSYAFWANGFPAVYFEESDRSAHYHQTSDVAAYLNMEYCTEIIRLNCALMAFYAIAPYQPEEFTVQQVGDGESLVLNWSSVFNSDLAGYNIYVSDENGVIENIFFTTDTAYEVSGLTENRLYNIGVAAVDSSGNIGHVLYREKIPLFPYFDRGIALVDESQGGYMNPSESALDSFYHTLLVNYEFNEFDVFKLMILLSLPELMHYSSIVWHINNSGTSSVLKDLTNSLKDYLDLGGNLLITADKLTFTLGENEVFNDFQTFSADNFISKYLGIDSSFIRTLSLFNEATSAQADFNSILIDTTKVSVENNYHLHLSAQAICPGQNTEILFKYGSDFESTSWQGFMKNMPIALLHNGEKYKTVSLAFPLYYMQFGETKQFIDFILQQKFYETTNNIIENTSGCNLKIWPNPADDVLWISADFSMISSYKIVSVFGEVLYDNTHVKSLKKYQSLPLKDITEGLYIFVAYTEHGIISKQFIKN